MTTIINCGSTFSSQLKRLADYRLEKDQGWTKDVVDRMPRVEQFKNVIVAPHSMSIVTNKWRLIEHGHQMDIGAGWQTLSSPARDYLDIIHPKSLRCTRYQKRAWSLPHPAPLFSFPTKLQDAVYVDLKATYWSVMKIVGWDVDYMPTSDGWIRAGRAPLDFPFPDVKVTRNSLVTAGLDSPLLSWRNGKWTETKTGNQHKNIGLWALIHDILHCIAGDAIMAGAVYVHTDGYIIPHGMLGAFTKSIERWGLEWGIKGIGDATVFGVGNYRVGEDLIVKSPNPPSVHRPFSNIRACPWYFWLLKEFTAVKDKGVAELVYRNSNKL